MSYKQLSEFEKGQIVAYDDCGLSLREIGRKLGRDHGGIGKFLKKYKETGNHLRQRGSGRKRATTASEDKKIIRAAKRRRTITAKEIKTNLNLNVTEKTIRNRLNEIGFSSVFQIRKPWVNEINRQKRVEWAQEHLNWTIDDWKRVLWSDESAIRVTI